MIPDEVNGDKQHGCSVFFSVNNTAFIFVLLLCYSRDENAQCANSLTHSQHINISLRVSRPHSVLQVGSNISVLVVFPV